MKGISVMRDLCLGRKRSLERPDCEGPCTSGKKDQSVFQAPRRGGGDEFVWC